MTVASVLVTPEWLAAELSAGTVCVLDTSWHASTTGRDGAAEFAAGHIPSARFLDLARVADPDSDLSHTLPPPAHLARCMAEVDARRDQLVVVYDNAGMAPSARAWWVLTTFGFKDVRVLDGGWRAWQASGFAEEQGAATATLQPPEVLPPPQTRRVANYAEVKRAIAAGQIVLDARSSARFLGQAPEPINGIPSGHIPGSINLPYLQLLDETTGRLLEASELRGKFIEAGLSMAAMEDAVVCTCGSGVTACVLALALESLGHPAGAVYDGSWTDWARRTSSGATA